MRIQRSGRARSRRATATGFSLIEVLIAILVIAFGLLGFALMQTMSLRFSQAANQRTQATNLAYDLMDQMRANRIVAAQFQAASFSSGSVTGCGARPVGVMAVATSIRRWQCQVVTALGPESRAVVTVNGGLVNVRLNWNEERWNDGSGPDFEVESRL